MLDAESTTPINSPAPGFVPLGQGGTSSVPAVAQMPAPGAAPQQNTSAILEALKTMAAKQTSSPQAAPAMSAPTMNSLNNLLGMPNLPVPQSSTPVNQVQAQQSLNSLGALFAGMNNGAQPQMPANAAANPLVALFPQQQPTQAASNTAPVAPDAQATLQLVQMMASQGIPPDQWATGLQFLNMQNQAGKGAVPFPPPPIPGANIFGQTNQSRDRDGFTRSPPDTGRRRSRSPDYGRRRDRGGRPGSPGFDPYRNGGDRRNDRNGSDYRQRSPVGRKQRSPSPPIQDLPPPGEKFIDFDPNMAEDSIKVLSRTLFVGGVTSSESHLRSLFSKFGLVQTCIVNVDKRHAFVKMINRKDAELARNGMEEYRDGSTQLRVSDSQKSTFQTLTCDRQNGVLVLDHETAVTIQLVSVSFPSFVSPTPTENGWSVQSTVVQVVSQSRQEWLSRNPTLKLVLVSHRKVSCVDSSSSLRC